jgi:hypothetical protein
MPHCNRFVKACFEKSVMFIKLSHALGQEAASLRAAAKIVSHVFRQIQRTNILWYSINGEASLSERVY